MKPERVCHWCRQSTAVHGLHHENFGRACCHRCFDRPDSKFHLAYGPDADESAERAEVLRAKGDRL